MEFFYQLPSNPWIWSFTVILTVAAFVLAYRSTPGKKIKCRIYSKEVIKNKQAFLSKLNILYDGKSIDRLTITKITFWNNSFPTINSTDIIEAAPFSAFLKNGSILECSVLEGDNTPNCIDAILLEDNRVKISFNYLDRKEGGIIQVVHTGDEDSIDITRKIKGGKVVVAVSSFLRTSKKIVGLTLIPIFTPILMAIPSDDLSYIIITSVAIVTMLIQLLILNGEEIIPKNCR